MKENPGDIVGVGTENVEALETLGKNIGEGVNRDKKTNTQRKFTQEVNDQAVEKEIPKVSIILSLEDRYDKSHAGNQE